MTKRQPKATRALVPAGKLARTTERRSLGRARSDETLFPVASPVAELPSGYATTLRDLKQRIEQTRLSTIITANTAMIRLYWHIGDVIRARQERAGWGAKVIDRLSHDLRQAFPDMGGLSSRNLQYMRTFAGAWSERAIAQAPLAQLTWYHHVTLLDKLEENVERLWYAERTVEHGWSRNVLAFQIASRLRERRGRAPNNFKATLPPADSDFAAQVFKDPYLFDFLGTADPRREQEVEDSLVAHMERFLLELGAGFAFVGRQVCLEVGGDEFKLDLLFYHFKLRRFVVVELKSVKFDPGMVGQLHVYLSAVDDLLKQPDDQPTIGLLLCRGKNQLVVEYALRGINKPMGVADWETRLVEQLPADLEGSLPTIAQIEAELAREPVVPPPPGKPTARRKTQMPRMAKPRATRVEDAKATKPARGRRRQQR
ncbi:MAG TPA: PDDEXK nuclease domain-containing protein [Kofleriaceae bacterium]|nr:PDDEXK nuclease domain-containing protein [Kofleriaceae bacterium]